MRTVRLFAALMGLVLLAGPVAAQRSSNPNAVPVPSTDPALSLQANAAFLKANANKQGVIRRPSGLQYKIIRNGYGRHPGPGDTVEVYYTGTLINGTVFDGTSPGLPASFNVTTSGLVQGWVEVLQLMREGDHWQVWIPASLAYGARGRGPVPPDQTISFDLRLLSATPPARRGEKGYVPQPGDEPQQ